MAVTDNYTTGRTNVAQHLELLNNNLKSTVHPPPTLSTTTGSTTATTTTSTNSLHAVNPPPIPSVPPIPNAHLHPTAAIPPSTILESLSSTARTSAEKSGSKIFSLEGGLKEAVENALQTGVQEQVEVVVDTAEVLHLNLGEVKL
jgi:hypothetical protein